MPCVMAHKFRFGVQYTGSSLGEWQDFARKAEDLGFSTLAVQDHFGQQLSPFPLLMAAAAVTTRLRLATIVLDNDFRNPAAMVKEAASVDVLTNGRLELGLGAGWVLADYEKTGLAFGPAGERFERLAETVQICKAFFSQEAVSFQGKHYHVEGLDGFPKPIQKPHPPIMIGGRQKRMLSMAAREADIVGISLLERRAPGSPKPATFAEKVEWVRQAAGSRIEDIELHINASNLEVTDNREAALERIAARLQVTVEEALQSPAVLVGSVDAIVEQMLAWRERFGVSYFVVGRQLMDMAAPIVARLAGQ